MNTKTRAFVSSVILISVALGGISTAEAQRLGGGTSFGSKSSYSAPMKRADLPPSNRAATPPAQNYQQPQHQPAQTNSNSAWKDRAMGAAAGLAVGGVVGAMMGGDNHNQQPAPIQQPQGYAPQPQQYAQPVQPQQSYAQPQQPAPYYADNNGATRSSGFSFLNFLLLGGLGYLAYRLFFAKKNPPVQPNNNYQRTVNEPAYSAPISTGGSSADFNTDIMFKKGDATVSSSTVNLAKSQNTATPAGFDTSAFLDDVKHRYMDLQQAWDAHDLAEIRGLTTDKVFAEIQSQLKGSTEANHTDVLKLDADLLEIRELSSEFEAVVLFDTIMRENAAAQANQVREVWHFIKSKSGFNAQWMLDGIQQLED